MKYYLLLILVLFVNSCIGQKKDSSFIIEDWIPKTKYDSTKVLMLVCDTSFVPNWRTSMRLGDSVFYEIKERFGNTWWQFGYEVCAHGKAYDPDSFPYKEIVKPKWYLDEYKKPLPKSIIVWMTKEIKNQ